jgi:hypothetical protein
VSEHADYESIARNRISNISFAVSSAGEIVILAIMVGILKALKSDASVENNTKAFSVLIAFAGGVWCKSIASSAAKCLIDEISAMRFTLVLLGETSTRPRTSARVFPHYSWVQADICGLQGVHEAEADFLVPYFLFPHVGADVELKRMDVDFVVGETS